MTLPCTLTTRSSVCESTSVPIGLPSMLAVTFLEPRARARMEEYDTTVIALRRLVELEPGNPDALWRLAETYGDKLGMISKGSAAYRDFERLFASDPRAGEVSARIRAWEEAAGVP